jgi:hypothetical protein
VKPPDPRRRIPVATGVIIGIVAIALMALLFRIGLWIATGLQHVLLGGK